MILEVKAQLAGLSAAWAVTGLVPTQVRQALEPWPQVPSLERVQVPREPRVPILAASNAVWVRESE